MNETEIENLLEELRFRLFVARFIVDLALGKAPKELTIPEGTDTSLEFGIALLLDSCGRIIDHGLIDVEVLDQRVEALAEAYADGFSLRNTYINLHKKEQQNG